MYCNVVSAIARIKNKELVLISDSKDRENEADLVMAAEYCEIEHINFMINHAKGLICTPLSSEITERLQLALMNQENEGTNKTAFTMTVDYIHGTSSGISSADRAKTVRALADLKASAGDFERPGHIFPLRAHNEGVLARQGHTEAAIDLMKLAGLTHAAVICETLDEEGEALRGQKLIEYSNKHSIPILAISDLVDYLKASK